MFSWGFLWPMSVYKQKEFMLSSYIAWNHPLPSSVSLYNTQKRYMTINSIMDFTTGESK